ncbi:MAG: acyl-CoA reductase, partial [Kaistella sp.]
MNRENQISGLHKLGLYIKAFLESNTENFSENDGELAVLLRKSEIENPWFTLENQKFALNQWADLLTLENINNWLSQYKTPLTPKRVGLILAGNIPMVGFHDVISVVLSNHIPVIKLSSKDKRLLPFLLEKWNEFSDGHVPFEIVERLDNFDAVIATGSNNTAR